MGRPERTRLVAGSPEWHAWRRTGVGSSDIAVITGDAPWRDASVVSLYQEKLNYTPARVQNASMEAGQWLEDLIARWYAKREDRRVRRLGYGLRSRSHPFAIASPDREVPGRGLLEVKIADHPGDDWGEPGGAQIPDHYLEQVQWQAHVADVDVVDVAVFFTRTRRREVYTVERDPTIVEELLEYGAGFWRCVEQRTPPEPLERSLRLPLREDEIEADDAITELVGLHDALAAEKDEADVALEAVRKELRAKLADVGGARGDGFRIAYRYNRDSTVTNWEAVAGAYRNCLELIASTAVDAAKGRGLIEDLDQVVADLTSIKPGARPLVVRRPKENTRAAA